MGACAFHFGQLGSHLVGADQFTALCGGVALRNLRLNLRTIRG